MENVFNLNDSKGYIQRINNLTPETKGQWGKMAVGQMLAHLSVSYDGVYNNEPKAKGFKLFMLKLLIKPIVVGKKSYKKNSRTAPNFLITDLRDFEVEKKKIIDYIEKTQNLGESHFDMKESTSFGKLTVKEWNILFAKHLNHHLEQFGV